MALPDDTPPDDAGTAEKPSNADDRRTPKRTGMRIRWQTTQLEEVQLTKAANYMRIPVTTFVKMVAMQCADTVNRRVELQGETMHVADFDVPLLDATKSFDPPTSVEHNATSKAVPGIVVFAEPDGDGQ